MHKIRFHLSVLYSNLLLPIDFMFYIRCAFGNKNDNVNYETNECHIFSLYLLNHPKFSNILFIYFQSYSSCVWIYYCNFPHCVYIINYFINASWNKYTKTRNSSAIFTFVYLLLNNNFVYFYKVMNMFKKYCCMCDDRNYIFLILQFLWNI